MSPTLNFKRGFSLTELSVVLVVMGILVAVAIPIALNVNRTQKVKQAEKELENIRELIISYYRINGKLPPHDASYRLPTSSLGIPEQYRNDPIKGIPYLYFADTVAGNTDTIYVDNVPLGDISAVIISAGPNGKFDGENATPDDRRFESTGTGDFDDVFYYVCELDLENLKSVPVSERSQYCETYTLILRNKDVTNRTHYARIITNASQSYTINPGGSLTLQSLLPYTVGQVSTINSLQAVRTLFFNISSYNEGNDCTVEVVIYSNTAGSVPIPLFTGDLSR